MGSAKVPLCIWVKWKKTEEMAIQLTPKELEEEKDIPREVKEIIVEKAFNSKIMEIFQGSNIGETLEKMFGYIKTGIEKPSLPKSSFTLGNIMHLDISFHELQLTRGRSYIDLLAWIANKKAVLNPRNEDDEVCFKWAGTAALHHEDISSHPERISKLESYSDLYNWEGLEFPVTKKPDR